MIHDTLSTASQQPNDDITIQLGIQVQADLGVQVQVDFNLQTLLLFLVLRDTGGAHIACCWRGTLVVGGLEVVVLVGTVALAVSEDGVLGGGFTRWEGELEGDKRCEGRGEGRERVR